MGEEIFTFLRESKYSVSLITVPFCPVAPCPFQILAGVLSSTETNIFNAPRHSSPFRQIFTPCFDILFCYVRVVSLVQLSIKDKNRKHLGTSVNKLKPTKLLKNSISS